MINFLTQDKRRVDWTFGVGYGDDLDQARALLKNYMMIYVF
jgi:small conductance mechanosensitive channel